MISLGSASANVSLLVGSFDIQSMFLWNVVGGNEVAHELEERVAHVDILVNARSFEIDFEILGHALNQNAVLVVWSSFYPG